MSRFNHQARETLSEAGFTTRQWALLHGCASAAEWRGDECGCTDDRCIGYHHEPDEDCQCLAGLIEDYRRGVRATERGRDVWTAHRHAESTGTAQDRARADELLAAWIVEFYPEAVSYAITPQGITYRNRYNDREWTIFDPAAATNEVQPLDR